MNYYDFWEYDTIEFLEYFTEAELDCSSVSEFLKKFDLEHYDITVDLREAKRIILVDSGTEFSFSSTDLSWISDRTKAIVCSFENRNLIFVDLDTSRDTYYINSAALIKIFNKAFPYNNCYVFKTCDGLAVGSMRRFNSNIESNFCITQLFTSDSLQIAAEFFDELLFDRYETIPYAVINYSPQERVGYVRPRSYEFNSNLFEEQMSFDVPEEPVIYTTYREASDALKYIAEGGDVSSFEILEDALLSREKSMSSDTVLQSSEGEHLVFEDENDYSADAYADAEQMLKEMLNKM